MDNDNNQILTNYYLFSGGKKRVSLLIKKPVFLHYKNHKDS